MMTAGRTIQVARPVCAHSAWTAVARRGPPPARGMVSVLAMLFLALFACLALAFYFATSMSAQVSANEMGTQSSQLAAESGMAFFRYQLTRLNVPPAVTTDKMMEEVHMQLEELLAGTRNLGARSIGYDGCMISVPEGDEQYVKLTPEGQSFRITLIAYGDRIVVKSIGSPGTRRSMLGRAIETEFKRTNRPSGVFDYGIASRGRVQIKSGGGTQLTGSPDASASILATQPGAGAIATGSGAIEGDLYVVGAKSDVALGGGSVGGTTDPALIAAQHTHVVPAPEFPLVDTTPFKPFATNTYAAGVPVQKNIRVPANTNPKFNAGDVINGILYVESPNAAEFRGDATVNGIIVFEAKNTPAVNSLDFRGTVSPRTIPAGAEYDALRAAARGWAIAAPTASVKMSGSVSGSVEGSVVAHSIALGGSADLKLKHGSLIALGGDPVLIEGKGVQFTGTAAIQPPVTGIRFTAFFSADLATYREVVP